jgi:hypothetical protein
VAADSRIASIFACVICAAFLLTPRLAVAQDEGLVRVYLTAIPADEDLEPIAARVGAAARASLRQLPGVEWASADRQFLGYNDFTYGRLSSAREKLDQGRQAYLNLELAEAIALLSGAVEDFDASGAALEDAADLGEALLFLGASQVFEGQNRAARRTFARLHVQMPYLEPDPNLFNPEIIAEYERSAPRDAQSPQSSIVIESDPPGAIAYVDYVARGRTPVTVTGLAAGSHIVRVTRPGATPFVQEVTTSRRSEETINAFLEDNEATPGLADAVQGLRTHPLEQMEEGDALSSIAVALELDRLGIIQVSRGDNDDLVQLRFMMFDVSTGDHSPALVGPVPIAFGALEAGVRQLVTQGLEISLAEVVEAADEERIPARGGAFTRREDPEGDGPAFYETWWFWTIVGVVVVGAATAGIIAAASSGGGQDLGQRPGGQVVLSF